MSAPNPGTPDPGARGRWADLGLRVMSAAVLIVVAGGAVLAGGAVFHLLILAAVAGMLWELARLTAPAPTPRLDLTLGGLAAICVLLWPTSQWPALMWPTLLPAMLWPPSDSAAVYVALLVVLLPFLVLLVPPVVLLLTPRRDRVISALYGLGVMVAVSGMLFLRESATWMLLWVVLVVVASDTLGYFAGRMIGGAKFWPRISPKKTWSGTVAGWIGAALVGALFVRFAAAPPVIILLSPLVALAGQFGDIMESWLKRRAGVKDASNLIPGHGGLLDRFDALLGAMLFYPLLWAGVA